MGDLRNKARKEAEKAAIDAYHRRRGPEGWTVFHFDLKPNLTRRNLFIGEAIRHLTRVTSTRISFWRCPLRGLAIQYRELPLTSKAYDRGEHWKLLHFSDLENVSEAKRVLVMDLLLKGIRLYRALPNRVFDQDVEHIRWLLTAPPSVSAEDWNARLERLDRRFRDVLRTHEAELRFHLLGEEYRGPTGPVAVSVKLRLETLKTRA
ncbi:MAG: hypothetical protein H0U98_13935 [Alphaproteobacteria bacterium]|nr:hypothetical protein [Alphaproteobacteria bacterium]